MVETESNYKNHIKNGSFRVNIPVARVVSENDLAGINSIYPKYYEQLDTVTHTVQMLTQNDYADGWRQVIPFVKRHSKKYYTEDGTEIIRVFSNAHRMKVNLAQLPEHLWHRMQYVDENIKIVNNRIHHYVVERTNVDDEIRELANILNRTVDDIYRERVYELLNILKDNDVYGWVIIKAKNNYK